MTKEVKNKGGRPQLVLTNEQITQVEDLSGYLTCEQIADYFGIDRDTFLAIRKRQPEVFRHYKKGKSNKLSRYSKKLESLALEGNDTTALIFFLKTQGGWTTKVKKEKKSKFDFLKDKTPLELIDSTLEALKIGKITIQEAQQIANLATTKLNIKNNLSIADITAQEKQSDEDLMAKVFAINRALDYQEKLDKEKNV